MTADAWGDPVVESRACTPTHGPRPAGPPDSCFYCRAPVGTDHVPGCVLRQKVVEVVVTIRYPVLIPEDWTPEQFLFARNEGTWCADNLIHELDGLIAPAAEDHDPNDPDRYRVRLDSGCLCFRATYTVDLPDK